MTKSTTVTLTATITALNLALSLMPMTRIAAMIAAIIIAGGFPRDHEDARADNRSDAHGRQAHRSQDPLEPVLSRHLFENDLDGFLRKQGAAWHEKILASGQNLRQYHVR